MTDRIAGAVASGFGAGLLPMSPGTFGSLEGIALFIGYAALAKGPLKDVPAGPVALFAIINVALFAFGVWAASRVCSLTGLGDPQKVVIDEISGQLIALTPLVTSPTAAGVIAALVLFRLLDIFKPYPINKLEGLHGGLGVMADDGLAGVLTAALIWFGQNLHKL